MQAHREPLLHLSVPDSFLDIAKDASKEWRASVNRALLPPNLLPLHDRIDAGEVFDLIRSDGLPLAPVPRAEVALELIEADDRLHRRAILERRAVDIAEDCKAVIAQVSDRSYLAECALEGIEAQYAGFTRSAQALFTVIATTIVDRIDIDSDASWSAARRRKGSSTTELERVPDELGDLPGYMFWVAAPLWHAYPSAPFGKGAELPDRWSRNASTHAVSGVHYNLANSVTAMMFVTALLDLIGIDTEV